MTQFDLMIKMMDYLGTRAVSTTDKVVIDRISTLTGDPRDFFDSRDYAELTYNKISGTLTLETYDKSYHSGGVDLYNVFEIPCPPKEKLAEIFNDDLLDITKERAKKEIEKFQVEKFLEEKLGVSLIK